MKTSNLILLYQVCIYTNSLFNVSIIDIYSTWNHSHQYHQFIMGPRGKLKFATILYTLGQDLVHHFIFIAVLSIILHMDGRSELILLISVLHFNYIGGFYSLLVKLFIAKYIQVIGI